MSAETIPPDSFNQKKVEHIFHYTKTVDSILGILKSGYHPSYCQEEIGELQYLIPMVSFCNISIKDVGLYMRYGEYGIGMSVDWALSNKISPVIYVHENSPFSDLHSKVNKLLLWDMVGKQMERFRKVIEEAVAKGENPDTTVGIQKDEDMNLLAAINEITVPALQFFKNWKINYYGKEIVTYQEREWRYIPGLVGEKKIVSSSEDEYKELIDEKQRPKPHLPKYALAIKSIDVIKYIIIKDDSERMIIFDCLTQIFGSKVVIDALVGGRLMLLTNDQIRNDF
ncbi:MAG TPA: abortive infection system antitoxin AbiGi family protein [Ignavibacteriaceae bacterium]